MKMSLPLALSLRKQNKALSLTLSFWDYTAPTFIRNREKVTIYAKVRKGPLDAISLSFGNFSKKSRDGWHNIDKPWSKADSSQKEACTAVTTSSLCSIKERKNYYGMGSGVEGMSGGWKKIIINNRDLYARPARHKPSLAKTNFASQAGLKLAFLLVELA